MNPQGLDALVPGEFNVTVTENKENPALPQSADVRDAQRAAQAYVDNHLAKLCREVLELETTGLFGAGALHTLRQMCGFAGSSAQSLALGMVNYAAVRYVAAQASKQ